MGTNVDIHLRLDCLVVGIVPLLKPAHLSLTFALVSAFPDLPLVYGELKIFGEESESEPGNEATQD